MSREPNTGRLGSAR